MEFPRYPKQTIELPARQLVSFPMSWPLGLVTRLWMWWLKLYINSARYSLTVRGRSAKTPKDRAYGGGIKLDRANRWGLYINDKFQAELDRYHRAQGEYEAERKQARLQDALDAINLKAATLKVQAIELRTLAHDRAQEIERITERLNTRTEILRLLRCELTVRRIPWGVGTCQDMADIFEANGYGAILSPVEDPRAFHVNRPTITPPTDKVAKS